MLSKAINGKTDIFEWQAKGTWVINPVNTEGIMGAGLALQFKKRFDNHYVSYRQLAYKGGTDIHQVWIDSKNRIIAFPTKYTWRHNSNVQDIELTLIALKKAMEENNIYKVAMPRIGCGKGGLSYKKDVRPLIEKIFKLSKLSIVLLGDLEQMTQH